jgi:hypothetical protein
MLQLRLPLLHELAQQGPLVAIAVVMIIPSSAAVRFLGSVVDTRPTDFRVGSAVHTEHQRHLDISRTDVKAPPNSTVAGSVLLAQPENLGSLGPGDCLRDCRSNVVLLRGSQLALNNPRKFYTEVFPANYSHQRQMLNPKKQSTKIKNI